MYESKATSELREGDVVLCHGMRCLIDRPIEVSRNHGPSRDGSETLYTSALVLNVDEVREAGFIPMSFLEDRRLGQKRSDEPRWTIQGNDLARWAVEPREEQLLAAVAEAEVERVIDARVMRRLRTDRAYLNAENAEDQAEREAEITRQEEVRFWGSH